MIKKIFLFIFLGIQVCHAQDILDGHHQLLVVTTSDWDANQGILRLYERAEDGAPWESFIERIPVVVGKSGLAWGIGLHPMPHEEAVCKKEGDLKAPAGIFSLGEAFGFAPFNERICLQMRYLSLHSGHEAVDDPDSRYYNQIVNREEIADPDWNSSEKMREISLYTVGFTVNHNFPNPRVGAGSAIFFHVWRNAFSGTGGCTAMDKEDLMSVLSWLNEDKKPLIVQLPVATYEEWQKEHHLPVLSDLSGELSNNVVMQHG
jgi:L,D-peptidoglycan transpeptidase YkuD (ErfK/YbiS/YcfS/YnhG family)